MVQVKHRVHVDNREFCAVAVDGQRLRTTLEDVLALFGDVWEAELGEGGRGALRREHLLRWQQLHPYLYRIMLPLARAISSIESLAATAVITSGVLSWLNTSRSRPELLC